MSGILDGVRVVDASTGVAGPITAMLLADHGADVVRVEAPGTADTSGDVVWQRGKRRVVLDPAMPAGRDELLALAAPADLLIESFAPDRAAELGLEHDAFGAVNRRLV